MRELILRATQKRREDIGHDTGQGLRRSRTGEELDVCFVFEGSFCCIVMDRLQ